MTKILYFARMRQIIGKSEEHIDLPADVTTVSRLIDCLKERDDAYASAFADLRIVRAAIDQAHAPLDALDRGCARDRLFPAGNGRVAEI